MSPTDDQPSSAEGCEPLTSLLERAGAGDPRASVDLLPVVYDRLRALADRHMQRERRDHTLQAAALVHDAYLRLVQGAGPNA